jgi:hypothetical protein
MKRIGGNEEDKVASVFEWCAIILTPHEKIPSDSAFSEEILSASEYIEP